MDFQCKLSYQMFKSKEILLTVKREQTKIKSKLSYEDSIDKEKINRKIGKFKSIMILYLLFKILFIFYLFIFVNMILSVEII